MKAIVALDQSTTKIGWVVLIGKDVESFGELDPDKPHYDLVRTWIRDMAGTLMAQGYKVTVVVEDVYLATWNSKPQVHVYDVLLSIREHIHAATRDIGAGYLVVKPYDALVALSGVTDPKTKRENRKRIMIAAAELTLNEKVSEHVADSLGLAFAAYNKLFAT